MELALFFLHGTLLLLFGVFLSGAFAGVSFQIKKNIFLFLGISGLCGGLEVLSFFFLGEDSVWELYPISTHLPLFLLLWLVYRKRPVTAGAAVLTAYLFCQPVKWCGVLANTLTGSSTIELVVRSCLLPVVALVTLQFAAPYFAKVYNKDTRSICLFGMMPAVYYLFDYVTMIYTDLWMQNNRIVAEFLPCFLGVMYMIFCILYCKESEEKTIAEHKAEITKISVEQQKKELEALRRNEQEIRLLHHDMRLFLSSLSVCLEEGNADKAKEQVALYLSRMPSTKVQHFCKIDTINYILSDFAAKCQAEKVAFVHKVELDALPFDINMVAAILSNALDNTLNAQKPLEESQRSVKLLLKTANNKLLLSVENPVAEPPVFVDGLPVSTQAGHGYGTQSIRYMTERLNGKCQFSVQNHTFIVKVIL